MTDPQTPDPTRDLRVRIAEQMGWTHCDVKKGSCGGDVYEKDVWFMPGHPFPQTADWIAENGRIGPPAYDSDMNAAMTLCDEAKQRGWLFTCDNYEGLWCAGFLPEGALVAHSATHPNLATAIAMAWLKVF